MSRTATFFKAILFLLALWIAGTALYSLSHPERQSHIFSQMIEILPWAGLSHIAFGSFALILGSFQISSRLRRKNIRLHERIGKTYVACVLIATVGAIATNMVSPTTWPAKSAFWLIAIVWPVVTIAGYPRGVPFDPKRHGRFMLWSYALTCSAITLRLVLIPQLVCGIPFSTAYPIAAWAGFSINITLLELLLWRQRARNSPSRDAQGRMVTNSDPTASRADCITAL